MRTRPFTLALLCIILVASSTACQLAYGKYWKFLTYARLDSGQTLVVPLPNGNDSLKTLLDSGTVAISYRKSKSSYIAADKMPISRYFVQANGIPNDSTNNRGVIITAANKSRVRPTEAVFRFPEAVKWVTVHLNDESSKVLTPPDNFAWQ